jgi:hypothetical protein
MQKEIWSFERLKLANSVNVCANETESSFLPYWQGPKINFNLQMCHWTVKTKTGEG